MKKILIILIILINYNQSYSCYLLIFKDNKKIRIKSDCYLKQKKEDALLKNIIHYQLLNLKEPNRFSIQFESKENISIFYDELIPKTIQAKIDYKKKTITVFNRVHKDINNFFDKQVKEIIIKFDKNQEYEKNLKTKLNVIIDPGHGGTDSGAISVSKKLKEKDITLIYAKKLKEKLNAIGINVILTRDSDKYVALRKRVEKIEKNKGNLFISIHADSINASNAKGASVYTISNIHRKHQDRKLFQYESYVPNFIRQSYFSEVIIDLYHSISKDHSTRLGNRILYYFKQDSVCISSCKIRSSSFAVLRRITNPSVLIEIGYLSNVNDEKKILSKDYTDKILDSIVKGIIDYKDKDV